MSIFTDILQINDVTSVRDICKGILGIEFERDLSVGLGATLGDWKKNFFYIFTVSGIFPRKANSIILLGIECTI